MTHLLRRPVATYAFDDLRVLAGPSAADDVDMLRRDVHLRRTAAELFKLLDVSGDALRQRDAKKGAASNAFGHGNRCCPRCLNGFTTG